MHIKELIAEIERPPPVRKKKYYEIENWSGKDQVVTFEVGSRPQDIFRTGRQLRAKGRLGSKARSLVAQRLVKETKRKGNSDDKVAIMLAEQDVQIREMLKRKQAER